MPITFYGRFQSFYPLYNDHIKLPEDFGNTQNDTTQNLELDSKNSTALEFAYINEVEGMRIIGIMSCLRARKSTFLCGIGGREHTTTNPFVTGISNYIFTGLQVTSRRLCWWSRTKAFLSSEN